MILKRFILILVLFASTSISAQSSYFRTWKPGWTSWESDSTFYEDGKVKQIAERKFKRKYLASTTKVYKEKITEFDMNGRWFFKQKVRIRMGCYQFREIIIWTRQRNQEE